MKLYKCSHGNNLCMMWLGMFADSEDIDRADQDKVDTATTSLPTSTGIGTTAATSQGIVMFLCYHLKSLLGYTEAH